ncbi:MAG TPA: DMT family transporter [Thermoplasmata archaeon]|nr:DMT family transporter [Thermoplasmata archaeon]
MPPGTPRARFGLLLVLLTATFSGVATFVNFWAVQGTNSDAFLALRNALVALILLPLALLATYAIPGESRRKLRPTDWGRLLVIGLVGGAIPFVLFFRGLQMAGTAGAATASYGYRTLFLMATVLGVVFLKERLHGRMFVAAALLLIGNGFLLSLAAPIWTDGTLLVLVATALWAGEYGLSKRLLRDLPSGTVAAGRVGFGALFLFAYVGVTGQFGAVAGWADVLGSVGTPAWWWMILSVILLAGFVSTWYAGLRHVDLSVATTVLLLGFPITWALGLLVGRTSLGVVPAAGAVAVVLGVGIAVGLAALRDTWSAVVEAAVVRMRRAPWT